MMMVVEVELKLKLDGFEWIGTEDGGQGLLVFAVCWKDDGTRCGAGEAERRNSSWFRSSCCDFVTLMSAR